MFWCVAQIYKVDSNICQFSSALSFHCTYKLGMCLFRGVQWEERWVEVSHLAACLPALVHCHLTFSTPCPLLPFPSAEEERVGRKLNGEERGGSNLLLSKQEGKGRKSNRGGWGGGEKIKSNGRLRKRKEKVMQGSIMCIFVFFWRVHHLGFKTEVLELKYRGSYLLILMPCSLTSLVILECMIIVVYPMVNRKQSAHMVLCIV